MIRDITCPLFSERLPELLERELPEPLRSAMERHAAQCEECGPLLADLRALSVEAAHLPALEPARDLWSGISERIGTPVIAIGADDRTIARSPRAGVPAPPLSRRWMLAGIAATLLVAASSLATYAVMRGSLESRPAVVAASATPIVRQPSSAPASGVATASQPPAATRATPSARDLSAPAAQRSAAASTTPPGSAVVRFAADKRSAESVYDGEIARLRAVVDARRAQLDPVTVNVIERNLSVIDSAIAQCRDALRKDPASRYLSTSLHSALANKVELLRTAATLPART